MENINKKWTHEEHEILKENYPTKGLKYCSETLKRSKKSVYAKIRKLKLKCTNKDLKRNVKYTKELVENAVKNALCLSDVIRNLGLIPQAGNYDNIKNRINEWLPSYELPQNSIEFEALKQTIFTLDIYQDRNRVGNNMYSSALKHYGDFLKEIDVNDKHGYGYLVDSVDSLQTTQLKWSENKTEYSASIITKMIHIKGTGKIEIFIDIGSNGAIFYGCGVLYFTGIAKSCGNIY